MKCHVETLTELCCRVAVFLESGVNDLSYCLQCDNNEQHNVIKEYNRILCDIISKLQELNSDIVDDIIYVALSVISPTKSKTATTNNTDDGNYNNGDDSIKCSISIMHHLRTIVTRFL